MSNAVIVLRNGAIVRRDGTVQKPSDIFIRDGIIEAVQAVPCSGGGDDGGGRGAAHPGDYEEIDCSGCFVSPGLVNLHTHSPMTIFRGMAEDVDIDDWFNAKIFPYESRLLPEDVRTGAMMGIYEMLDSGVTAFCDHYFMAGEIVSAARETGIRADVAPTVFGSGDWQKSLRESVELIEEVNGQGGLVRARLGPHAPYTCPPEVLKACAEAACKIGVGIHIHVSETAKQVEDSLSQYGRTPVRMLKDAGILDQECILAHATWMKEDEISLLEKPPFVALAPKTYLKLASGIGNLYRMLKVAGYGTHTVADSIRVGIGTDGAASSNTLNPLEEARLFALLGKDQWSDATSFTLKTGWQALMAGHDALHQGTGDVAPGMGADLIVWDLAAQPGTWPYAGDPLAAIIYSADNRNVRDVLIAGKPVKRCGEVISVDREETMARVDRVRRRLLSQGAGTAKVKY